MELPCIVLIIYAYGVLPIGVNNPVKIDKIKIINNTLIPSFFSIINLFLINLVILLSFLILFRIIAVRYSAKYGRYNIK